MDRTLSIMTYDDIDHNEKVVEIRIPTKTLIELDFDQFYKDIKQAWIKARKD